MDRLNFHHLRYFWAVAKEGSLRRASEVLRVSQPAMSAQIKQLEEQLGVALLKKDGRGLAMTEAGGRVFAMAEEIFGMERELVATARGEDPRVWVARFPVGITDVLPKSIAHALLRGVLQPDVPTRLSVREGLMEDLLGLLHAGRVEMILANSPAPSGVGFQVYNHFLGTCSLAFMAMPALSAKWKEGFPGSLHGQPALLPGASAPVRRELDQWFLNQGIEPRVVAEFDDPALMKVFASEGSGFVPVPSLVVDDARKRHGLEVIARVPEVREDYYAITMGKVAEHPGVALVLASAAAFPWDRSPTHEESGPRGVAFR